MLTAALFATGCVYKGERYELDTVAVTVGTGQFIPGGNVTMTFQKQPNETPASAEATSGDEHKQ